MSPNVVIAHLLKNIAAIKTRWYHLYQKKKITGKNGVPGTFLSQKFYASVSVGFFYGQTGYLICISGWSQIPTNEMQSLKCKVSFWFNSQ